MATQEEFRQAAEDVKSLEERPGNEDLLRLYAYFKQGSEGPVSGKRPGALNMVARAKYDAWQKLGDMSQDDAMQAYIDTVNELRG